MFNKPFGQLIDMLKEENINRENIEFLIKSFGTAINHKVDDDTMLSITILENRLQRSSSLRLMVRMSASMGIRRNLRERWSSGVVTFHWLLTI